MQKHDMPRIRQPFALGVAAEVQTTLPLKAHKKLAGHYQRCPNHQSSISWLNVERPEIHSQNLLHSPASTSHMPVYLKPKLQATKKNDANQVSMYPASKTSLWTWGPKFRHTEVGFNMPLTTPPVLEIRWPHTWTPKDRWLPAHWMHTTMPQE